MKEWRKTGHSIETESLFTRESILERTIMEKEDHGLNIFFPKGKFRLIKLEID